MRTKGPILTLLAVVVLALILLAVNLTTKSATSQTAQNAPVAPPVAAAPPAVAPAPAVADPANPFPAQATYTGKTSGRKVGEASVAVAVHDGKASAYLCDGKKLESWLDGRAEGSSLRLTGKNGSELTATLQDGHLIGDVSVNGASWGFSAIPGKGPAGLYRARNGDTDAGWIVYPNGQQTGVQDIGGDASEAPVLDPAAGSAVLGGTAVPVTTIQGGDAATVGR
ncbi:MAG: hypothetical protein M3Z25_06455 [Actinomycetota bacterium]|nr:hypothetical protein [Actinomycetota bacterium]